MADFQNKTVFITGASSGIGRALAREFARRGAAVGLAARRVDRLERVVAEVRAGGGRAIAVACDVTRDGALEAAIAATRRALGPIHVAVANAGFGVMGAFERLTLEDHRRQLETNLFGVLRTAYAALPDLKSTRGTLVIVGSVSSHIGLPGMSSYAMSKFAVRGLAQVLRAELATDGVSVVLVNPGYVESEMYRIGNDGRPNPNARDRVPTFLRMRTHRAARRIVNAVARDRAEAMITEHAKLAVWLARHAPWLVAWGVRHLPLFRS